jgi:hypothetical protein
MKYTLNGTWINDSTILVLPAGATPLTDAQWDNRNSVPYQPTLAEVKTRAYVSIDATSESTRAKYCTSPLLADEYKLAYNDAVAWLLDQTKPVPTTVQDWANINSWTPLASATNIKTAGDGLNAKLVQIRAARLTGKNNVSVAVDNVTAIAAQNAAIAALAVL